jgi:hypothetical protein
VPAITEFAQLDASGTEQLRLSRLAMDLGPEHKDRGGCKDLHDLVTDATPASASPRSV